MIVKRNTVILYHATKRKNLSSILKHGLDPNFAKPYQPTPEEIKVYLNSKGIYLDSYEPRVPSYYIPGIIWLGDEEMVRKFMNKALNRFQDNSSVLLRVEIPKSELNKIKITNPALLGCKSAEEFIGIYKKSSLLDKIINFGGAKMKSDEDLRKEFQIRKEHMTVVMGKINPKYITIVN